ncbi:carboxylesterase/lipase family protein [Butyrivibrio sp. AD3002]|uniref:carboxylesterase/lipase family protein n=1 Tax=Butyrivibrio sp. AD3002 TaxID=1280670 RepID=UPI0003B3C970|nr:carboxylesterase family protein [Butyrivibrio sp. AD3002]
MYPRKLTRSIISNPDYPVVDTPKGKIRGLWEEDVFIFRGIQYARAERFHLPQEIPAWEGTKEAIIYGPVCPEMHTPIAHDQYNVPHYHYVQDEECHYLNIWTRHIEKGANKPVMVWIHGGGFATGSSIELYAYDGHELCDFGDVVVVSINHRLNCIGYLDLSGYGDEYRYTGNLGQADLVAALKWINENIEAFGGDPGNVTIMGQSGGGCKVSALLQTPSAVGLFHKAVIQSGLFEGFKDVTKEQAAELSKMVVDELGLTDIHEIETIPYYKLARAAQKAEQALQEKYGFGMYLCPVADNDFYLGTGMNNPFMEEAKNIPVLVGSVLGEFDQNYNQVYAEGSKNFWDDEKVWELLNKAFGNKAKEIVAAQQKAYPGFLPVDSLYINRGCRVASRDFCKKRFTEGCAPAYNWLFTLESPFNNGTVAWHNVEEAYMFHNANYLEASYIPGVSEELQDIMTGAWVSFAYNGDPNHVGMPLWHPVDASNGSCMLFDRKVQEGLHHDDELMEILPAKAIVGNNDREPLSTFGGGPRQSL